MKKYLLFLLSLPLFILSCDKEPDPYLISASSVGRLTDEVRVSQLDSVFAQDSLVSSVQKGEYFKRSNEIEVYDQKGERMLLLKPVQAFDSTSTIGFVQVLDSRYKTAKGLGPGSTFKDIVENYTISRIENTMRSAVVFIDDMNIYVTIDKKQLPAELRYDSQVRIQASQIPDEAEIKHFMISWD